MRFSYLIIQWYQKHKRDLPWRHTSDPYHIWVSEIILQQTRVDQGLDYYHRFIGRFPDVETLAMAEEEEVMKVWQGLGYYSRARNMHHAAKTICNEHQSVFPASYDEIRRLQGIGDYSASAITSIAYGEPHPVIDGNVMRLVARYTGILEPVNSVSGRKKVKEFLDKYIDREQPGIFNQAAMEMGALICKPKQPLCEQCPINANCFAARESMQAQLPVIKKPKKISTRYFHYLFIYSGQKGNFNFWLRKRTGTDIWKNLYDFPLIEAERSLTPEEIIKGDDWNKIAGMHDLQIGNVVDHEKYLLTHRELRVKFFLISSDDYSNPEFIKTSVSGHYNYPVPRLIENFLKNITIQPGIFSNFPD